MTPRPVDPNPQPSVAAPHPPHEHDPHHIQNGDTPQVPALVVDAGSGVAPVVDAADDPARWSEGSAQRAARAYEVLGLYVERAARMVHSAPPGAIAPVMRTLLEVARLEGGQSTSNVAVVLTPQERRARILELSARLGAELVDDIGA